MRLTALILTTALAVNYLNACSNEPEGPGPSQDHFCSVVQGFIRDYNAASKAGANAAGLSQIRYNRRNALVAMMKSGNATNWKGVVKNIDTDIIGNGELSVRLSCGEQPISDVEVYSDRTIDKDSPLYATLIGLRPGNKINLSGSFEIDSSVNDYIDEKSLTEDGSMTNPEFGFRFRYFELSRTLAAREPSFDCNHAHSQSEHLICADAELSTLDADFGILYKKAKNVASDKAAFVRANRIEWQRRENACFDKACLIDWYAQRKLELLKVIANAAAPLNDNPLNGAAAETETTDGEKENLPAAVQRVRAVVTRYANRKGETELEFYDRINTPLAHVAAFALTVEHLGGTIEGAVQSLDGLSNALQNPDKVKLLECMGIEVYVHPTAPPPNAMECKQVEQRLGIRRAANSE
jgi:uncharacterized protein